MVHLEQLMSEVAWAHRIDHGLNQRVNWSLAHWSPLNGIVAKAEKVLLLG